MSSWKKFLFLFWIFFLSIRPAYSEAPSPPPLRGMALGLFSKESNYDYFKDLKELKTLGVNAVLVPVPWYQRDVRATKIQDHSTLTFGMHHVSDELLGKVIDQAHGLGMKVLLFPYLRIDIRSRREWRGVLDPKNFAEWALSYERFLLHYADLAKKHRVDILSIGSELGSMESKEEFWNDLIGKVKERFPGKLTYSANWDHYHHPRFWQKLDYISVSAYYQLSHRNNPTVEEMEKKWREYKKFLLSFAEKQRKKILFTELGYPSIDGAGKAPWNYVARTPPDPQEQADCYQAFIRAWNGTEALEGVYWWVWYGEGGWEDKDYTPRGKPAAEILKNWYRRLAI